MHVFSFTPEFDKATKKPTGLGFGRQGSPFIGMSGSAVCPREEVFDGEPKSESKKTNQEGTRVRTACGIFYGGELAKTNMIGDGKEIEKGSSALYVPGQQITKWFQEIL